MRRREDERQKKQQAAAFAEPTGAPTRKQRRSGLGRKGRGPCRVMFWLELLGLGVKMLLLFSSSLP